MKNQLKFLAAATLFVAGSAYAQSAGSWLIRAGATQLSPSVTSSCLSAPDFGDPPTGCTKSDVSADTQLSGGITYMFTDHWAVDVPVATPFTHKISGAGALAGAGDLGKVKALPATVFLQYRFLEAKAKFRPYVGLGATYAYFFDEEGSGRLTATTNPGGTPTQFTVDSKWIMTPIIGASIAVNEKWFVNVSYSKSLLSTTTHFSTGQHMDVDLDPASFSVTVGYTF